jgi:SAM-dependent methyltransferase
MAGAHYPVDAPVNLYVQQNQPAGVPPLKLTGERTLPDVPAENYWYRRHLAVYEWIAARVPGAAVLDMACGEGYGSAVLARSAASVLGVDGNPEAFEHARLKYTRPGLSFAWGAVETFGEPGSFDAVVFLQTIEHVVDPPAVLAHFRSLLAPGGVAYVSTPNVLTLAPPGAVKSDNPWHLREYRAEQFAELCRGVFPRVEMLGLFHARKLWLHQQALRLGWDRVHRRLGVTQAFYDRFTPAISATDFALRPAPLHRALDFLAVCRAAPSSSETSAGPSASGSHAPARRPRRR